MRAVLLAGAGALALALGLAGALAWMHGNARYQAGMLSERAAWQAAVAERERQLAAQRAALERRATAAAEAYAARLAAQEPVVLRSHDTVIKYAATPAGAALCLAADRVRGIEADAAELGLAPAGDPGGGGEPVPADETRDRP